MKRTDQRKYHYIYKITRDDGKFYVGMHSTDDLNDGYFGSGKLISRSLKKYGLPRHRKEILEFLPTRHSLKEREREIVNEELVGNVMCMNLQLGGGGGFINESHEQKFRSAALEATKKRHREKGQPQACLDALVPFTAEMRCDWTGRKHREETRLKMSASHRGLQDGEKNSQFGSKWVCKDSKPIKIKADELESYLAQGYHLGRK